MGPWSNPSNGKPQPRTATLGPAEWALMVGLAALVVLGAVAVWCSRYEIGLAGGVPARLDRFTGRVIGCIPGQGCQGLIPAGEPAVRGGVIDRPISPAPEAASGNAAPAASPPSHPTSQPPA